MTFIAHIYILLTLSYAHAVFQASTKNAPSNLPSIATSRLVGHDAGPIRMVKFTSDGKYCLTAGHDRTVRLWNPLRVDPAAFQSKTGRTNNISALSSNHQGVSLHSLPPALPIQAYTDGHNYPVSAIDMDDLSTTLVSSSEKTVVVTDILTQKLKRRFQGHAGRINSVACSKKGGSIFCSASYDGTVRIWDGRSFSSDPVQILQDATDSVSCVKILENSKRDICEIMTCSVDGCVRTYDVRRGCINTDDFGKDMSLTCFVNTSDDLCTAVSCLNGSIHIEEKSTGMLLGTCFGGHAAGRYSLECSMTSEDEYLVSGSEDGRVVFYDWKTGHVVQSLEGHSRVTTTVACHPKVEHSSVLISGSYDGNAIVWTNGDSLYLDAF
jgi:FOG: WD40 repeat